MTGLGDRILGLGLLVLAVAYGWVAQQWPEPFGGAEAVGPETFPTILSVVLVVGSLYLMVKPDPDAQWPVGWRCSNGNAWLSDGGVCGCADPQ